MIFVAHKKKSPLYDYYKDNEPEMLEEIRKRKEAYDWNNFSSNVHALRTNSASGAWFWSGGKL